MNHYKGERMKPISEKRQAQLKEYYALVVKLSRWCHNRSELSGNRPTEWQAGFRVEPHHILGRRGKQLLDPFGIIMLTATEHAREQQYKEGCHTKEELLNIVKPIRIKQGFME